MKVVRWLCCSWVYWSTTVGTPIPNAVGPIALIIARTPSIRAVPILLPVALFLIRLALVEALLTVKVTACHAALVRARADLGDASLCRAAPRPRLYQ